MEANTYICEKCRRKIVTIHDDCGTTPFMLKCRATKGCDGRMLSQFGRVLPGSVATHEWFRRTDIDKMTPDELDHHVKGGAFIRRLDVPERIGERREPKELKRLIQRERQRQMQAFRKNKDEGKKG